MIDILFVVLLLLAVIKGLRRGLAIAVFSILAYIIGLAAALKLSATVAVYLQKNVAVPGHWLPFLSFFIVFAIVVVLVNLGAKLLDKTFELAFLGWVNKAGGVLFYLLMYTVIFSIFLFYAEKIHVINKQTINDSVCYPYVKPWGPIVINGFGKIIPFFKDSFQLLETYFGGLSDKINH